ncbi:MAG: hypothetical protein S4CHLAM2_03110 [Chlamydiales bacterium]|nr:hypothetical protein [Chlamydiales bacterium]
MTTQIAGYYTRNGILYRNNETEDNQDAVRRATACTCALIAKNAPARQATYSWAAANNRTFYPILSDTIANPWFWVLAMPRHSPRYHGYPNSGCSSCSAPGDGEGCAAVALIIAIIALASLCIVATGFTIYQGVEAEKERRLLREIEACGRVIQGDELQTTLRNLASYQREEWISQSSATFFSATVAAGLGCLTVSAAFALYGILNATPISAYATIFAVAGGSVTSVGLAGHLVRYLVARQRQEHKIALLKNVYLQLERQDLPHPYKLLDELEGEGIALVINGKTFLKNAHGEYSTSTSLGHHTRYTVEERA